MCITLIDRTGKSTTTQLGTNYVQSQHISIQNPGQPPSRKRWQLSSSLKSKTVHHSRLYRRTSRLTPIDALKGSSATKLKDFDFCSVNPTLSAVLTRKTTDEKIFKIVDAGLGSYDNQLQQRPIAKARAKWIEDRVEIRSTRQSNLLHGKMYHIAQQRRRKSHHGQFQLYCARPWTESTPR